MPDELASDSLRRAHDAIQRLRDATDPQRQREAIEDLFDVDTPEARAALLEALARTRPGGGYGYSYSYSLATLVSVLGARGERRAVGPMLALLNGPLETGEDHQIEAVAIEALTALGATEALPTLSSMLFDKRRGQGLHDDLAEAMARLGGAAVEPELRQALTSKRRDLARAGARGLCFLPALSAESRAVLAAAERSKNDEVRTLARLATAATSAEPGPAVERLVASATDYPLRRDVLFGLRALGRVDLTARFAALATAPAWKDVRFDLLQLFTDQRVPGVDALLEAAFRAPETPYTGAVAGALLLGLRYEPDVVDGLLAFLGSAAATGPDDSFAEQALASETIADALTTHTAGDRERRLRWGLFLDDVRRQKVSAHPRVVAMAGDHLERLVGSRFYADFDAWVARGGVRPPPSPA